MQELIPTLTRDSVHIRSLLSITKDGRVVCNKPIEIHFPDHYLRKQLAEMHESLYVLGMFVIVDREAKRYALMNVPAKVMIPISEMDTYQYNEDFYRQLKFDAYDTVIATKEIIADDKLMYWMYSYFIELANIPWYMEYNDLLKMYDQTPYYMGNTLGSSTQIVEMIIGNVARSPDDIKTMYRHYFDPTKKKTNLPNWIALRNMSLGAADTFSKVMGSYFDDGVTSALAEPSKTLTNVEKVLRA